MSYLHNVLKTELKKKMHYLCVFTSVKEGGDLTRKPDEDILVSLVGLQNRKAEQSAWWWKSFYSLALNWSDPTFWQYNDGLLFLQKWQLNSNQVNECLFIPLLGKVKGARVLKISRFYCWPFKTNNSVLANTKLQCS